METPKIKYTSVDEYISGFPPEIRTLLEEIRAIIIQTAPNAKEIISYNMPAYKQNGVLVYYAANKGHIGFYPTGSPVEVFKNELKDYKTSKGAIKFPFETGIPHELVKQIVQYRIVEDAENAERKKKK